MKKNFNENLESLRGFCAIIVVLHHAVLFNTSMGNQYGVYKVIGRYEFPGHTMVLVFFILSGYVIGLSYYKKTAFNSKKYIINRLIRLYPIYTVTILITSVVFAESIRTIIGNLLFCQNLITASLAHDSALWSLNHELVYYILAIPILKYKLKLDYLFVLLFALLLISVFLYPFPAILEGYLVGFIFWLTGFHLSIYTTSAPYQWCSLSVNKFLSILFLLLASDGLNLIHSFFKLIPIQPGTSFIFYDNIVSLSDFSVYIICLYTILLVIGNKWSRLIGKITYIAAWGAVIEIISSGVFFTSKFFYIPLLFLSISTVLFYYPRQVVKSLYFLVYLGEISYGIYIVHLPIMFSIGLVNMYNDTLSSYLIRVSVLLVLTIAVSHLLEKVMQAKIKKTTSVLSLNFADKLSRIDQFESDRADIP